MSTIGGCRPSFRAERNLAESGEEAVSRHRSCRHGLRHSPESSRYRSRGWYLPARAEELSGKVHGEMNEKSWRLKQALLRWQANVRKQTQADPVACQRCV